MRDLISDGFIKRLGLHMGAPLGPTTEEITAYEDEAARREGQVPEATSQVVLPLSQEDLFEGDVPSTPKTDKSKAAREANVTPWRAGCYVPSPPCNDLFGPTNFYEEEKKLEASAAAFAKWWKEAPRPRRKKRPCTENFAITGWLPKLRKFAASTDTQETQETPTIHTGRAEQVTKTPRRQSGSQSRQAADRDGRYKQGPDRQVLDRI